MIEQQRFAALFPGQGAQKRGMGIELYENSAQAKRVFDDADVIARKLKLATPISEVCFKDPKNQLSGEHADTAVIQPALLTYCVAKFSHLNNTGMHKPDILLGHSAGKYSALVAAESLDLEEAL